MLDHVWTALLSPTLKDCIVRNKTCDSFPNIQCKQCTCKARNIGITDMSNMYINNRYAGLCVDRSGIQPEHTLIKMETATS